MKLLITGAASGIGKALAERMAGSAASLVLIDRAAMDGVAEGHDRAARFTGDVSNEEFWERLAPELEGVTHAAINAGISSSAPIEALDFAEWRRVLSVNLDGAFLTLRAVLRAMNKEHSGDRAIVVTSSASATKAEQGIAAYGASKAAVIQLARVAAKEVAARGVRVNIIAPGGVDTPIWDSMDFFADLVSETGSREAAIAALGGMATPLGRYASAQEIAGQIAFLLSAQSAPATGAVLAVDGGYAL